MKKILVGLSVAFISLGSLFAANPSTKLTMEITPGQLTASKIGFTKSVPAAIDKNPENVNISLTEATEIPVTWKDDGSATAGSEEYFVYYRIRSAKPNVQINLAAKEMTCEAQVGKTIQYTVTLSGEKGSFKSGASTKITPVPVNGFIGGSQGFTITTDPISAGYEGKWNGSLELTIDALY